MALKTKTALKPGASSMFVGRESGRPVAGWRLDVREDATGRVSYFRKRKRAGAERGRMKLFHYIAAGGMRQMRRTTADDIAEGRRRAFMLFLGALLVVWTVFYLLPSA